MGPVDLFLFAQPLDFVLLEQVLKDHAMQIVEFGPRNLTLAYFVHRRPVSETPAVGEPRPVNIQVVGLAPASSLGNHGTAPVHDGAEYIEDACLHVTQFGLHPLSLAGCGRTRRNRLSTCCRTWARVVAV